jgi:hypothetical protein
MGREKVILRNGLSQGFERKVDIKELEGAPDFTTMYWRVSRINIKLDPFVHLKEEILITVDSN